MVPVQQQAGESGWHDKTFEVFETSKVCPLL